MAARWFTVQGNFDQAKRFYEEALQLRELIYGGRGVKVGESLQNIATVNEKQGHLSEAEVMYKEALSIFVSTEEVGGQNSRDIATVYNNLGLLYNAMGRMEGKT